MKPLKWFHHTNTLYAILDTVNPILSSKKWSFTISLRNMLIYILILLIILSQLDSVYLHIT